MQGGKASWRRGAGARGRGVIKRRPSRPLPRLAPGASAAAHPSEPMRAAPARGQAANALARARPRLSRAAVNSGLPPRRARHGGRRTCPPWPCCAARRGEDAKGAGHCAAMQQRFITNRG